MAVDIFSGILTGAAFGPHVTRMHGGDAGQKRKLGHFACAVDVRRVVPADRFVADLDRMIDELHEAPPAEGRSRVLIPGKPEQLQEKRRLEQGIPVPVEIYQYLSL